MRVLMVADQYYPIGGGIEQYLRGLGRQLRVDGHDVTIITRALEGLPREEDWPEGRVVRTAVLVDALREPEEALSRWQELRPLIREAAPDVVYANNHASLSAIRASQAERVPVVYGCHGWGLLCTHRIRLLQPDHALCYNERGLLNCMHCHRLLAGAPPVTGVRSAYHRLRWEARHGRRIKVEVDRYDRFQGILDGADARIGISRLVASLFPPKNTYSVYYGVDLETYRPTDPSPFLQRHGIPESYVLVSGRIHNTKGQDWAVRSLSRLPRDIHLVLAGTTRLFSGPEWEESVHVRNVRAVAREEGVEDRVHFVGLLETEELARAYSGALATLVPSVWLEAFGYVTAEAMACGCPVVVTENCGSAEIVTDRVDGYVVPRMDAAALAEATLAIVEQRNTMGDRARRTVAERLNWPRIAGEVMRVFRSVIGGEA